MNKLQLLSFCTLLSSVFAHPGFGQAPAKPKLSRVENYWRYGKIEKAKLEVDAAENYVKTKDNPKTYYLRGLVYAHIDTSSVENIRALSDDALRIAAESFQKAEQMNTGDSELFIRDDLGLPITIKQHVKDYVAYYYNSGGKAFMDQDFDVAIKEFQNVLLLSPLDTSALMNAGLAAHNLNEYELAKQYYVKCLQEGSKSLDIYKYLVHVLTNETEELEYALEWARKGVSIHGDEADLVRREIDILVKLEKHQEAVQRIDVALDQNEQDGNLWFVRGVLFENLVSQAQTPEEKKRLNGEAKESYKKSIEIEPELARGYYNYGIMLIEDANEYIQQYNGLGVSAEDAARAEELKPIMKEKLLTTLPVWEKLNELSVGTEDEQTVKETLKYLRQQLNIETE